MMCLFPGGKAATVRPLYPRERDPVFIVKEAGWSPGLFWTGAENLAPTVFDPRTFQPIVQYKKIEKELVCCVSFLFV